jgi:hypothetical protein
MENEKAFERRWLYSPSGESRLVTFLEQEDALRAEGWNDTPKPKAAETPKPLVTMTGAKCANCVTLEEKFNSAWKDLTAKHVALNEQYVKLQDELAVALKANAEFEQKIAEAAKPAAAEAKGKK